MSDRSKALPQFEDARRPVIRCSLRWHEGCLTVGVDSQAPCAESFLEADYLWRIMRIADGAQAFLVWRCTWSLGATPAYCRDYAFVALAK